MGSITYGKPGGVVKLLMYGLGVVVVVTDDDEGVFSFSEVTTIFSSFTTPFDSFEARFGLLISFGVFRLDAGESREVALWFDSHRVPFGGSVTGGVTFGTLAFETSSGDVRAFSRKFGSYGLKLDFGVSLDELLLNVELLPGDNLSRDSLFLMLFSMFASNFGFG